MARDPLVLWRWAEVVDSQGWSATKVDSIGGQMRGVEEGDKLFICGTTEGELYLAGHLEVARVELERSRVLQEKYGRFSARCRNVGGPFQVIPLEKDKWKLRFVRSESDRLNPNIDLFRQVRTRRFLDAKSAALLERLLKSRTSVLSVEQRFIEGERRISNAARTIRNANLRVAAKNHWGTDCYCCGFDFRTFYGDAGEGIALVHHIEPFAQSGNESRASSVDDVRIVCANCHYLIHSEDPPIDVDTLRRQIRRRWTKWSNRGVKCLINQTKSR